VISQLQCCGSLLRWQDERLFPTFCVFEHLCYGFSPNERFLRVFSNCLFTKAISLWRTKFLRCTGKAHQRAPPALRSAEHARPREYDGVGGNGAAVATSAGVAGAVARCRSCRTTIRSRGRRHTCTPRVSPCGAARPFSLPTNWTLASRLVKQPLTLLVNSR
jgi:hypothetical protein